MTVLIPLASDFSRLLPYLIGIALVSIGGPLIVSAVLCGMARRRSSRTLAIAAVVVLVLPLAVAYLVGSLEWVLSPFGLILAPFWIWVALNCRSVLLSLD